MKKIFIILCISFLLASCDNDVGLELEYKRDDSILEQYRIKWENLHIDHYKFSIILPYSSGKYGKLPMPLIIGVKNKDVISIEDAKGINYSPIESNENTYYIHNYFTIPALFTFIHRYYVQIPRPPSIEILYNQEFGFPEVIKINPFKEPCCQGFEITIKNFEVMQ